MALALLILAPAAPRLVRAAVLPLCVVEAYAIAAAREFSFSFLDHQPLGFWLPVAAAYLTGWEHPLTYRLPFVALGTLTGWALWRIGHEVGGTRAGMFTLVLWLIAPHMAIGSALSVVPDGPLNAGAALAVLILVRAMRAAPLRPRARWSGWRRGRWWHRNTRRGAGASVGWVPSEHATQARLTDKGPGPKLGPGRRHLVCCQSHFGTSARAGPRSGFTPGAPGAGSPRAMWR